jgi:hypothetical protein
VKTTHHEKIGSRGRTGTHDDGGEKGALKERSSKRREEVAKVLTGANPRKNKAHLPKADATVGEIATRAAVDSDPMVNTISAEKAEETGLPAEWLDKESFGISGIYGTEGRCTSWMPEATIYVTSEMKPTSRC